MDRTAFSPPPHFRRNFWVLITDYVAFGVAFSFVGINSVLPAFVRELTDSEPVIGLVATVFQAGWILPQLGVAAALSGRSRQKPLMMVATIVGRSVFLVLALAAWAGLPGYPVPMLVTFFACLVMFTTLDGVTVIAWFDILARAVPLARRGRLVGTGQVISGLLGMTVGGLVTVVLDSPALPFPSNYALLFTLAAAVHVPGVIALSLLKEPPATEPPSDEQQTAGGFVGQLRAVWREDANFRRFIAMRWLVGAMGLASSFYILHAQDVVGLSEASAGWFVSAERAGGIVASLGLGWLSERRGPRPVIWLGSAATLASPVLALVAHYVPVPPQLYLLIPLCVGVTASSWMLGEYNYLLEMAPAARRPLYIGLANTLMGVLTPASFVGGVLLRATSYPALFAITAAVVASGFVMSLRLADLRREASG